VTDQHSPGYFAAQFDTADERQRLALLAAALDPISTRHLTRLGVGAGGRAWRCLEVGAGGGSIARWLADQVAPRGRVVATDIETRFLDEIDRPNVEVRRHDVTVDPLEPLGYDLVHCRLLLLHLADPAAVLQRLADAVAPGGLLLVEEWEYATIRVADAGHPLAAATTKVNEALLELTLGVGIDVHLGRRLPDLVEATGLVGVDHDGTLRITRGTPEATMAKASTALLRPALLGRRLVTEAELDAWFQALSDPAFRMIDYTTISVWGRRPPL
jgi:SAM-dependent methyltransferase